MSSPETVKIYAVDENNLPLVGVLVRVFDITGTSLVTQQVTAAVGPDAVADVTLAGDTPPIPYTIRMSKPGVAFDGSLGDSSKSPQQISVISPVLTLPNAFDVMGETFTRPTATNPRLCRCSGFFLDISGRPLPGLTVSFINTFSPVVVDSNAVMSSEASATTDQSGYIEIDLYRNGIYTAWVPGVEAKEDLEGTSGITFPRIVKVPNLNSANLPDLLFPVVASVAFGAPSVTVAPLEQAVLTPVVAASDGSILTGSAVSDVVYSVDDPSIAGVSTSATQVFLVGISPGTTQLRVSRTDGSLVKIPYQPITGQPITITVT
jgi:hypothetical protein